MKKFKILAVTTATTALVASVAHAATENVGASATFIAPVALSNASGLDFGTHTTSVVASDTIAVDTAGTVTASNSGEYITGGAAGSIDVAGENGQTVDIALTEASGGTYFSMASFVCKYGAGSETACGSGDSMTGLIGASATTMSIGATATISGTPAAGADNAGSILVTVTYQ